MTKSKKTEEKQLGLSLDKLDRQSLVSLGLGALVVVVVGLLVFNYFTQVRNQPAQKTASEQEQSSLPSSPPSSGEKPNFEFQPTDLPTTHVVQKKEHLWGLAKRYYNNGFLWVEIAKANHLKNPDILPVGLELNIPAVRTNPPESGANQSQLSGAKTSGAPEAYIVQKGDSLCKIARRIFGECRRGWDIAKANHLSNPDLITPGQALVIPKAV